MKKWSSQWTQFMQLRKEAWKKEKKNQDFNGVWTRDLAKIGTYPSQFANNKTEISNIENNNLIIEIGTYPSQFASFVKLRIKYLELKKKWQ